MVVNVNSIKLPIALNLTNKIVIDPRITIEIQTKYDEDTQDLIDDTCRLWSIADEGNAYDETIQITDSESVVLEDGLLTVRFRKVPTNRFYSCVIDQGDGNAVTLFQNMHITYEHGIEE